MPNNNVQDERRLHEIDNELEKIQKLFAEYHSWYDKKINYQTWVESACRRKI